MKIENRNVQPHFSLGLDFAQKHAPKVKWAGHPLQCTLVNTFPYILLHNKVFENSSSPRSPITSPTYLRLAPARQHISITVLAQYSSFKHPNLHGGWRADRR
jgi:hypothetical protein